MMAFFGMLAAMCLLGAWGLLVAGVAYALVQAGMSLWVALLLLGAGHLLLAWLLWRSGYVRKPPVHHRDARPATVGRR
jgi:membrane protein implicated in regulation of membrane protease activity